MIATAKVLRVRARNPGAIADAAVAVVAYVQGGQPESRAGLAGYYGRGHARGRARGLAADLVGLRGDVPGEALARLLRGEHAVTGRLLLAPVGKGSAGRVSRVAAAADDASGGATAERTAHAAGGAGGLQNGAGPDEPRDAELLTLAEASTIVGVSATYLRRLARRTAEAAAARAQGLSADPSNEANDDKQHRAGTDTTATAGARRASASGRRPGGPLKVDELVGERGADGRWRVRRDELDRWSAQRTPPATVLGYDVVCAAPKSVSLLWAFGDEALRADVAAALNAAVDAVIGYLERHATFGMVGGVNRQALGLGVASYLHDVSRSTEAHLHIHNIIINAVAVPTETGDPDRAGAAGGETASSAGRPARAAGWEWRAIDGEVLLGHVKTAGYLGAAVLRHELSVRRGVQWGPVRNGVAELAAFPTELLGAFSTRHGEVMDEFAQLVAAGFEPSGATAAAAQRGSRAPKRVLADAAVQALQVERLTAAGWTVDQVRALATTTEHRPQPPDERDLADLFDLLAGPAGLTGQATTFLRRDVVQCVAAWAGDRLDDEAVERLADRFLTDPRVVVLHATVTGPGHRRRNKPEPLYTVEGLLRAEDTLFALYRQGEVAAGAVPRLLVDPAILGRHLEAITATATATASRGHGVDGSEAGAGEGAGRRDAPELSAEQVELVRRLLASQDLVRPAVGPAGTGKTEAMRALTAILHTVGRRVFATAHGGRQAEELADRIGIPARVVASWLTLLDHTDDPADVWPPGSVLIVDEATQIGTRDAERLLRYATRTGTVVILLGDPAQLGSVAAGGWFTHLAAHTPDIPALATVHRQAGPDLAPVRAALGALRAVPDPATRAALGVVGADSGAATRAALQRLAVDGRLHLADSADALLERAVDDWYAERQQHARANQSADSAHTGATAGTATLGSVASRARTVPDTVDDIRADIAKDRGTDTDIVTNTAIGQPELDRDRRAAVKATGPTKVRMMAERHRDVEKLNRAARARLSADGTLTGPVLHAASQEFQAGDEVITLTQAGHTLVPDGRRASAYIRTGTVGVITAVHVDPDNPAAQFVTVYFPSKGTVRVPWEYLTHRFDDGRDGGLGHAYAITAAKAQGATMDTARAVVSDDTSRSGLYVMLSRARTDVAAYVVRRVDLDDRDDDESWLPPVADPGDPLDRLADRLERSCTERLATDHDPLAAAAHELRRGYTLAELAALRGASSRRGASEPTKPSQVPARRVEATPTRTDDAPTAIAPSALPETAPPPPAARVAARSARPDDAPNEPFPPNPAPDSSARRVNEPSQVLLRRAELAAEAAVRIDAVHSPPPALVARIGARPAAGPDRAAWEAAVGALAVYHARHQPAAHTDDPGPPPGAHPHDLQADPWIRHRDEAARLVDAWARALPPPARDRFYAAAATVPRERALAGLHALLDHGHHPGQLHQALSAEPLADVHVGAAVLDQRITDLCRLAGVDATLYDLPAPTTAQQEWNTVTSILSTVEINYLATQPTSTLAATWRDLHSGLLEASPEPVGDHQTRPGQPQTPRTSSTIRLARVEAALDRQITHAVSRATAEPAEYLTGLLGPQPDTEPAATAWQQSAHRVEDYRHRHLGLPYGTSADREAIDPTRRALGIRPDGPAAASYDNACQFDGPFSATLPL
ncbi:MobF family relaxase [Pseudofrankia sp. BMG5.36]|uniref:MobF family relaxase n=1 Tax=Pseudofrankia sp. BMG5.36 TaxID=1834512 RepID=UPI0008D9B1A8|nr:MobF family relaxase [Pseudofrankia sp. BMG5.36]OHV63465.1 TrwC relaxase [Pseudofrankia sp. BMG5.36]